MRWLLLVPLLAWAALGPWVLVAAAGMLAVPRFRWWVRDRLRITVRGAAIGAGTLVLVVGAVVLLPAGLMPIPPSPGLAVAPSYVGRPAITEPVGAAEVPQHPHLARNGTARDNGDAWATNAYTWAGPTGSETEVDTAWFGREQCMRLVSDTRNRLIALCGRGSDLSLQILDPESMRPLAVKRLPGRAQEDEGVAARVCGTTMYLDNDDRAVLATTDRRILAVATADGEERAELTTADSWDLAPYVPPGDCLVSVLPDWSGRIWWVSRRGLVGTLAAHSGQVEVIDLDEQVVTSLAADSDGSVYLTSDHALYRLVVGAGGAPRVSWRTAYDRGDRTKDGQLSRGSGSGPTLLEGDVVAIADNAEPRLNVLFVRRDTGEEICRLPVFDDDASATATSLVSVGHGVVVANNHGYTNRLSTALGRTTSPGLARVDVADSECSLVWTAPLSVPSAGVKVSWETGLAYAYTKRRSAWGVPAWYLSAVDVHTGRHQFSVRTGTGALFDNARGPLVVTPGGAAYVATVAGLVRVRDHE